MKLKELLIKRLSIKINYPVSVINTVITHQFDSANDAVDIHDTVELSGFGKYIFNKKRAKKRLMKFLKEKEKLLKALEKELSEKERNSLTNKLFVMEINIKTLKPRINEDKDK